MTVGGDQRRLGLPCFWHNDEGHTFRWARDTGVMTVQKGDWMTSQSDAGLVDSVSVPEKGPEDKRDLTVKADMWLRSHGHKAALRQTAHRANGPLAVTGDY